jgi:hypothetical protein
MRNRIPRFVKLGAGHSVACNIAVSHSMLDRARFITTAFNPLYRFDATADREDPQRGRDGHVHARPCEARIADLDRIDDRGKDGGIAGGRRA